MKKVFFVVLTLLINVFVSDAQQFKSDSIVKGRFASFIIHPLSSGGMKEVYDSKNIYHNKIQKNRNSDVTVKRGDESGLLNAFTQVFSDERLKQLLPERYMMMTFYLNPTGRVLEIEFLLNANTLITVQELEALEKAIKANVWFKLKPEEIKGEDFIDIGQGVRFSRVLDRTLK